MLKDHNVCIGKSFKKREEIQKIKTFLNLEVAVST